jgi:Neuraminidase (sialidase)
VGKLQLIQLEPTKLSPQVYQNTSSLAVSRTGAVAAFYGYDGSVKFYRISVDGGQTWGQEKKAPEELVGGGCSGALRDGGAIKMLPTSAPLAGEDGWFEGKYALFADDMTSWTIEKLRLYMPDAIREKIPNRSYIWWYPIFDKGKIIQLKNGDLLSPMYGLFKSDTKPDVSRALLSRSKDKGRTWSYYSTIAYQPNDPDPELPGIYVGFVEPTIETLPNGRMIAVLRTQGSHLGPKFRPLYIAWSEDQGKTWTEPRPIQPPLYNIWPTLQVLDSGVVACVHGRPGFHISFSADDGKTWPYRVTFSNQSETTQPKITGQVDMVKSGPNQVVAIGGTENGTFVFPVKVQVSRDE